MSTTSWPLSRSRPTRFQPRRAYSGAAAGVWSHKTGTHASVANASTRRTSCGPVATTTEGGLDVDPGEPGREVGAGLQVLALEARGPDRPAPVEEHEGLFEADRAGQDQSCQLRH